MPTAVTMPRLGLTMTEGTVVDWRARVGDPVSRGQVILMIESEKAEVEVEAFASGVLAAIYADTGATVPVGTLLGAIAAPGESFDRDAFAARFVPEVEGAPAMGRSDATRSPAMPTTTASGVGVKAAPAARVLARRLGVDLATVTGTGPAGRISVEDVERAAGPVARVNGTGLSYATTGHGPATLLVNGFGVDATAWRRQVAALAASHTVVTYEHRGIGQSWPIREPGVTVAQLAEDARALLEHVRRLPAVVVGSSMGAVVALELALAHPEAMRGLVLLSPIVERDGRFEAVLRAWREHEAPASEARIRAMVPWLLGRAYLAHPGRREAAAAAWRAMAARTPPEALRHHADALLSWLGTRTADLGRIDVPALVVVGADDVLTPPRQAEIVARGLRGRLEVIEDAGHALMIERADAVNELVLDFSARLPDPPA